MKGNNFCHRMLNIIRVLFQISLIAVAAFFILYNASAPRSDTESAGLPLEIKDWTVRLEDGTTFAVTSPYGEEPAEGVPYYLCTTLPDQIGRDLYLMFLNYDDTVVTVGGEVRSSFDEQTDVFVPGGMVKAFYMLIRIRPEDAGKEVTILRERSDTQRRIYPSTLLGTSMQIYQFLKATYGAVNILALIVLAISLLVTIAGIVLHFWLKRPVDMVYAGIAILIVTAWILTDSFLYPFLFDRFHIDGTMSYLLTLMIPTPFLLYMNALQKNRYLKWYVALHVLTFSSAFLWSTLHFAGIFPFQDALPFIDAIIAVAIFGCFVISIFDVKRGNVSEYKYVAAGFVVFLFLALSQIIVIQTMDLKNDGILMLIGLFLFMICVILQQLNELRVSDQERRLAEELSIAKTRFLAGMSHEIRTPVNTILGMNEMILRESNEGITRQYAANVQNAGRMLLALINDVLDFSKIEAGKLETTEADYNLTTVLSETVLMAKERASAKNLEFRTDISDNVPSGLHSDEVRIKQILINLLTNAVKYTDSGSVTLSVSGEEVSDSLYDLRLSVTDTGRGIREEEQKTLFDAFTRADMAINRSVEGTGLGLAIVKSIVDSMGGRMEVQSVYGNGSTFAVILPQKIFDRTPVPTQLDTEAIIADQRTHHADFTAPDARILAVDDNAANLSIVRQFLKETGVQIDCFLNGNDAIRACTEKRYDLIFLDHMMPDPDGLRTLKKIRSDARSLNQDTTAIVLTANAIAGSRQFYLDAGFADYLCKPVPSKSLEETVKKYLPQGKIKPAAEGQEKQTEDVSARPEEMPMQPVSEAMPAGAITVTEVDTVPEKWSSIEGLDYRTAVAYCGDEEVFEAVAEEIVKGSREKADLIREAFGSRDIETYRIKAHAIKSDMATIGAKDLSERAKQHEFAAKDQDLSFMEKDMDSFLKEYEEFCDALRGALAGE